MNAAALERLCMSFQGTTTDVKWGNDLCYLIGTKMYCVRAIDGPLNVSFKTTPEDFAELTEREGIIPAPYVARYHWVRVENPAALKPSEWTHFVKQSYSLVLDGLPKKLKDALLAKGKPVRRAK